MKHFKANGDFCIVDVEPNQYNFCISVPFDANPLTYNDDIFLLQYEYKDIINKCFRNELPSGNWKIIGLQSEIEKSEELSGRAVGKYEIYTTSTKVFKDLMQSLECYLVNPYEKPDLFEFIENEVEEQFDAAFDEWQQAQSKVSERLILRKV